MKKLIILCLAVLFANQLQAQLKVDRTQVPNSGPPPLLIIKKPVSYKLANGLTVLVIEDHRLPKVSTQFLTNTGPVDEGDKAGLMAVTASMLNEGTVSISKAGFDETIDLTGSTLKFNSTGADVSAMTRYFTQALNLMAKALTEPAFDQKALEKIKTQQLTVLQSQSKSTTFFADRAVNALAFGKDHPKGKSATAKTIQSITLPDVKNAYNNYITPSGSYLTIIGDITPATAYKLAQQYFGNWKGVAASKPRVDRAANPAATQIDVISLTNSVQSEISVISLMDLRLNSPDFFPLLLANRILGGGAESRLFVNLRDKHAFAYQQNSTIEAGLFQGLFRASTLVRSAKTDSAVTIMLDEIKRIQTERVSEKDLSSAKVLYFGLFALGMEDNARQSTFATTVLINNLPGDFYEKYLQKINAVTADDIMRVANKYFANTRVVITGDHRQFINGLNKIGYPVKVFDTEGNPLSN